MKTVLLRLKNKMILLIVLFNAVSASAKVEITALTVEGRTDATGLDVAMPRFGWQMESDRKSVVQRSYRILVASSEANLDLGIGDVWDSGTVKSDSSQWVNYKGAPLKPNRRYYWKVKAETNRGVTPWSKTASWSAGLLSPDNWKGCWIGLDSLMPWDNVTRHSRLSSRYLRREFALGGTISRATIHISGIGLYVLYINGTRVGNDVLTPVGTDYTKTVVYNTYDVTELLRKGDNAVGVTLAGGHYFAAAQNYQTNVRTTYGCPRLLANIIVEYADGSADTLATDRSWRLTADGPIRYANEYDGETYDARYTLGDWTLPGYDDRGAKWMQANEMTPPDGRLVGNITPSMCVYEEDRPLTIRRYGRRYIVDFGTNGAGFIRMNVRAAAGDTVVVRHAELLEAGDSTLYTDNLRGAEATARYVGDGKARCWAPDFTFYGFRYAEIMGLDNAPEDMVRCLVADRMDDSGTDFSLVTADGSTMLTDILANARRGVRSNYKGMPIDCPQRDERMPWLGDRTMGCFGESYLMNCHSLYAKWTADICQSQRNDGSISDVAPAYWRLYNGNVTWPAALPFACNMLHRQYGDLRPMQQSYDAIKRFLVYVKGRNKTGFVEYDRYGDWCVPPESPTLVHSKDSSRITDGRLIAAAYYQYLCRMMGNYARMFGKTADAEYFGTEAEVTSALFNERFLTAQGYSNGTVTANLLPLTMGMVPDDRTGAVADSILSVILHKHNGHVPAGVIGIQWLMRWLSDSGNGDLAYRIATTDTYPGWGYMVRKGATTIWELWNGDTANPSMNSGNHVMLLGDLLPWCYEKVAGIAPDENEPGFKHIVFRPDFSISAITEVSASHKSPYGMISTHRRMLADGRMEWTVTVPPNTTADVYLPTGKIKKVGSGVHRIIVKKP
ncbi:MAG: family 78 glycoside hydrolase catalytic domain [Prevotella sp.]